jgi:hypothetical protein
MPGPANAQLEPNAMAADMRIAWMFTKLLPNESSGAGKPDLFRIRGD